MLSRLAAPTFAALLALCAGVPAASAMGDRPGDFDYYALVLSWSPSFCLSGNGAHADDPQCGTVRPYAFVLHGLWPQFDKGWPESCSASGGSDLPPDLAQSMLDIMPSDKLVNHEFEKHGTCSGLDAKGYFGLARKLFSGIAIPPKYVNLPDTLQVPLDQLRSDLLAANPKLTPDMIAVDCDKRGRLVEVHFCFTKEGEPRACGHNEIQAKMCRQDMLSMPPVRGHAPGAGTSTATTTAPAAQPAAPAQAPGVAPAPAPAGSVATTDQNPAANDNAANDNGDSSGGSGRHRHRHHHHHHHHRSSGSDSSGSDSSGSDGEDN